MCGGSSFTPAGRCRGPPQCSSRLLPGAAGTGSPRKQTCMPPPALRPPPSRGREGGGGALRPGAGRPGAAAGILGCMRSRLRACTGLLADWNMWRVPQGGCALNTHSLWSGGTPLPAAQGKGAAAHMRALPCNRIPHSTQQQGCLRRVDWLSWSGLQSAPWVVLLDGWRPCCRPRGGLAWACRPLCEPGPLQAGGLPGCRQEATCTASTPAHTHPRVKILAWQLSRRQSSRCTERVSCRTSPRSGDSCWLLFRGEEAAGQPAGGGNRARKPVSAQSPRPRLPPAAVCWTCRPAVIHCCCTPGCPWPPKLSTLSRTHPPGCGRSCQRMFFPWPWRSTSSPWPWHGAGRSCFRAGTARTGSSR